MLSNELFTVFLPSLVSLLTSRGYNLFNGLSINIPLLPFIIVASRTFESLDFYNLQSNLISIVAMEASHPEL